MYTNCKLSPLHFKQHKFPVKSDWLIHIYSMLQDSIAVDGLAMKGVVGGRQLVKYL